MMGKLHIIKAGNQSTYELNAKILDKKAQEIIFEFMEEGAGLYEKNYLELKKLSYVGGQVKNIQLMSKIHDFTSLQYV